MTLYFIGSSYLQTAQGTKRDKNKLHVDQCMQIVRKIMQYNIDEDMEFEYESSDEVSDNKGVDF